MLNEPFKAISFISDVEDVKFVINFDYPSCSEDYVHRIGRTGRRQKTGTAYTFFTPNNSNKANDLIQVLKEANQVINPKLLELADSRCNNYGRQRGKIAYMRVLDAYCSFDVQTKSLIVVGGRNRWRSKGPNRVEREQSYSRSRSPSLSYERNGKRRSYSRSYSRSQSPINRTAAAGKSSASPGEKSPRVGAAPAYQQFPPLPSSPRPAQPPLPPTPPPSSKQGLPPLPPLPPPPPPPPPPSSSQPPLPMGPPPGSVFMLGGMLGMLGGAGYQTLMQPPTPYYKPPPTPLHPANGIRR